MRSGSHFKPFSFAVCELTHKASQIMKKDDKVKYIYRPWITVKGKRIYAKNYGKKAFRIPVSEK